MTFPRESPFEYAERILTLYPSGSIDVLKKDLTRLYPNCTPDDLKKALDDAAIVVSAQQEREGWNAFTHGKRYIDQH